MTHSPRFLKAGLTTSLKTGFRLAVSGALVGFTLAGAVHAVDAPTTDGPTGMEQSADGGEPQVQTRAPAAGGIFSNGTGTPDQSGLEPVPDDVDVVISQGPVQASTQPVVTPTVTPMMTPATQPTSQPTAQSTPQTSGQLATQPTAESTTQLATQPTTQPTVESTTQPITPPSTQPTTQPTAQPTTQPGFSRGSRASTQPSSAASTGTQEKTLLQPLAPVRPAWDHYQVVYQKNMFLKQHSGSMFRSDGNAPQTTVVETRPRPVVYASPVMLLTGVAVLDDDRMAFIETVGTGSTLRARIGDTLGGAKVLSIDLNGIEVEAAGASRRVDVGATLDGRSIDSVTSSSTAGGSYGSSSTGAAGSGSPSSSGSTSGGAAGSSGAPGAAPGAIPAGTSDEAAIRERLRRRRSEEMGR